MLGSESYTVKMVHGVNVLGLEFRSIALFVYIQYNFLILRTYVSILNLIILKTFTNKEIYMSIPCISNYKNFYY